MKIKISSIYKGTIIMSDNNSKEHLIVKLTKERPPAALLQHIAIKERSGHGEGVFNTLNKMSLKALTVSYNALINTEYETNSETIIYRTANLISKEINNKELKIQYHDHSIGLIEIVFFQEGDMKCIAETAKESPVENLNEFLERIKTIKANNPNLSRAYFITKDEINQEVFQNMIEKKQLSLRGEIIISKKGRLGSMFSKQKEVMLNVKQIKNIELSNLFPSK